MYDKYELLDSAIYFWEGYEDIDRSPDAACIYAAFPALERAFTNYQIAKRAVDAELFLLKREHAT